MKWTILASGSGGNTTYLESSGVKILIDCGITYKQIVQRLNTHNLTLDGLDGVLITHEHTDHIKGLDVTMKRHEASTYITSETYESLGWRVKENIDSEQISLITPYEPFYIKHIKITPISISHDASDAVGYIIEANDKKLVYVTDIGYLPKRDHDLFKHADSYIFESNYDVTMLFTSSRPFYLKQRIDSVKGHMSNTDSAYNIAQLVGPNTKHIILAHRSRECNTDELVLQTYQDVFADYGLTLEDYEVHVAKQDIPSKVFDL